MFKVLLIEEAIAVRRLISRMLERLGCEVTEAENGAQGVALYGAVPADAVLLEMVSPGKDALQTLSELRRLDPGVRVIILSEGGVYTRRPDPNVSAAIGGALRLNKPFSRSDLQSALESLPGWSETVGCARA